MEVIERGERYNDGGMSSAAMLVPRNDSKGARVGPQVDAIEKPQRLEVLLWLLLLAGCDPHLHLRGTVLDAAGKPVVGAAIGVDCPDQRPLQGHQNTTLADGRFELRSVGCLPLTCMVSATWDGGATVSAPVVGHCKRSHFLCGKGDCNDVELTLKPDQRPTP